MARPWSFDRRPANLFAVKMLIIAVTIAVTVGASNAAVAQSAALLDSTGKIAATPMSDTMLLVTVRPGLVAPALIRPLYDGDGQIMSGVATWGGGGSVLFESADCTSGAHVFTTTHAAVRATSQVETPAGVTLYVGAIGATRTVAIRSILYGNGCSPVTVRQSGLVPVDATVNLTTRYPPPLALQ